MKILSVITGIGYGHSIRQAALLNYLKNEEVTIAGYSNSLEYFKNKFETIEILGPKFPESSYKLKILKTIFLNLLLPFYYLKNYFQLRRTIKVFQPNLIITDFEPLPLYMSKNIPHILMFNFDPGFYKGFIKENKKYKLQKKYIDIVYNRAKKIQAPIIIPSLLGERPSKEYAITNPITRQLSDLTKKELIKKLNLKTSPIIISFGGSYFGTKLLHNLIDILSEINEQFLIFSYKTIGKPHKNITFMPFKENFLEYIKASKAVITMAGHSTLSELIVLKKPSLIFPIPNMLEQELNAHIMEKKNLAVVKNTNLNKKELKSAIKELLKNMKQIETNLNKLNIKANGAEQVYKIIKHTSSKS